MSKATIFLNASWVGLAALVIGLAATAIPVPEDLATLSGLICFLCCWVLLLTRDADEYTRGLWTSAASLAFTSLLVMMIVWPFLEGFIAGLRGIEDGKASLEGIIGCGIAAFYIGLFWKRFMGSDPT